MSVWAPADLHSATFSISMATSVTSMEVPMLALTLTLAGWPMTVGVTPVWAGLARMTMVPALTAASMAAGSRPSAAAISPDLVRKILERMAFLLRMDMLLPLNGGWIVHASTKVGKAQRRDGWRRLRPGARRGRSRQG